MHVSVSVLVPLALLLTTPILRGQIPDHATLLNPLAQFERLTFRQSGDVVHAFGMDTVGAYYGRSPDGGRTWPVVEQALAPFQIDAIAIDGDLIVICGRTAGGPMMVRSSNLGQTWSAPQQVATWVTNSVNNETEVHVDGQDVTLLWCEPINGTIWYRRSADGGQTWLGPGALLSQIPAPSNVGTMHLSKLAEGDTMHVLWQSHELTGVAGRMQITTDGGSTWLSSPRTLPFVPLYGITIAGNASNLLLSSFKQDLHRSSDGGITWTATPFSTITNIVDLAVDGMNVVAVGTSNVPFQPHLWVIETSVNGGVSWNYSPWQASAPPGATATAHIQAGDFYVDFSNFGQPQLNALVRTDNGGLFWQLHEDQVGDFSVGPHRNIHVRHEVLASTGVALHAYVGLGWSLRGSGTAGTAAAAPSLTLLGVPTLARTATFSIDNALGGALGVLGVSFALAQATPFAGGSFWLQSPLVFSTFVTTGSAGVGGAGSATEPLVVPSSPGLAGISLTGQAVVFDPVAVQGIALSNAIEVWIR